MGKRAILFVTLFLVVLGGGVLLLPYVVDVNQYRGQIQGQLEAKLNRKATLGKLGLKVFPLSVSVADLTISESPKYASKTPFATAKQVDVGIGLFALLTGNVEISSLRIVEPAIELIRGADGVWNYESLGSGGGEGGGSVSLRDVAIERGQVGVTDLKARKARSVYAPIDVTLREFTPGKRFDAELAARLPDKGDLRADLRGSGLGDLNGEIELKDASLGSLARFGGGEATSLDGIASGEVKVAGAGGVLKASGQLALRDGKVKNAPLGYPIDVAFDVGYQEASKTLTISALKARLGALPLEASGSANLKADPAVVDLQLKTQDAPLTELARLAGASGAQASGTLSANVQAKGALPRPALSGQIRTSAVEVRGGEIKQAVKLSPLQLALTPGTIRSEPFTAQAGGTSLNGSFSLTEYTSSAPALDLTLKAPNAQLAELIDIAKAVGSAEGISGTGAVSVDIRAQGRLAKDAPLAVSGSAALKGASLTLPQLAKPLAIRQADIGFRQNGDRSELKFSADVEEVALKEGETGSGKSSGSGGMEKLTGSGRITAAKVVVSKLTIENVTADCTIDRGIIRLAPLTAMAYKGRQTGSLTIDTRGAEPELDIKMELDKADANLLLSSTTSIKRTLEGLLTTTAALHLTPKPGQEPAAGLNGKLNLKLNQGKLQGISLMNEAAGVAKIMGFRKQNAVATDIVDLSGDFDIVNGVAKTENLAMKLDTGSAAVTGTINLVTQAVDLRMLLTLGKGLAQQYGNNAIGGLLTTAFGNDRGEIQIPVMATGTMAAMKIAPDGQRAAAMRMQGVTGQGTGETVNKVRGLIDAFRKKK